MVKYWIRNVGSQEEATKAMKALLSAGDAVASPALVNLEKPIYDPEKQILQFHAPEIPEAVIKEFHSDAQRMGKNYQLEIRGEANA